jgi:hypothetical protein
VIASRCGFSPPPVCRTRRAGQCQREKAAPRGKRSEAIRRLPQLFV